MIDMWLYMWLDDGVTNTNTNPNPNNLPWAAQVGTRRPAFFATREEAEDYLAGKAGWVAPSFMVGR